MKQIYQTLIIAFFFGNGHLPIVFGKNNHAFMKSEISTFFFVYSAIITFEMFCFNFMPIQSSPHLNG